MTGLAFTRSGAGAPLVLLHGLGSSRHVWEPVLPALSEHFDVIAIDLPGFGESAPFPESVEPRPEVLAKAVAERLDRLGVVAPHVAGNSLGGWVALELAHIRPLASLALLSPAGLWRGATPLYQRISLSVTRGLAEHAARPLSRVVNHRLGRILVFGQTHGRPYRMTPDQARAAIRAMGTCPGYAATSKAIAKIHYAARSPITTPVTVAFGGRDLLLLPYVARRLDELPPHTRLAKLPGCGHVPMYDDPGAVAALILESAALRAG